MGSVRRPRNGRGWEARYRSPDGRQRSKIFRTKRDADRFLARVDTAMQRGDWHDPQLAKVPFDKYAAEWLASTKHLRPGTRANVQSRLRRHILPAFGSYPLGAIQPAAVRSWVAELSDTGLAAATVNATYRTFARIMTMAEIDGLIARSPCIGVSLAKETSRQEMRFIDHAQVAHLAEAIHPRYRALIFTAAYTGLRWGELAALRVDRINFLRGTLSVVEALTEVNGHVHGSHEDGSTPHRVAPQVPSSRCSPSR